MVRQTVGTSSHVMPVDYVVVPGSNFKQILFLIYLNNLLKLNIFGQLFLFADDTLIFIKGKTWPKVWGKAMHDLMII